MGARVLEHVSRSLRLVGFSCIIAPGKRRRADGHEALRVVVLDPCSAGLAFARRIVRVGGHVTLLVDPSEAAVARSRGTQSEVTPFEPGGERWLATLRELAVSGQTLLAVPATDRASEMLSCADPALPSNVIAFERPGSAHLRLMNKESADAIAHRADVNVPWTEVLNSLEDLERVAAGAPWPCVVKPVFSHQWRARYRGDRVHLVNDIESARERLTRPLADGVQMLLCQYVPGGDDDVEEAIVVRLADGSYPVRFGCRKLRQWPPGFGTTAVGESSPLIETTAIAERVLDEAGFVGIAGVEVKRDALTGERWFLEVNVRMPGQWGLGDACGANASERLVEAMLGREIRPEPTPVTGVRMVLPEIDAHVVSRAMRRAPMRNRPALAWRLLRPYFGAKEVGMLDLRDPGPGMAAARKFVRGRLARVRARFSRV